VLDEISRSSARKSAAREPIGRNWAEFERDLTRERTGEGRKRAMAAGVKFGRKRKLSDYQRNCEWRPDFLRP
jgi:hypothetical protein